MRHDDINKVLEEDFRSVGCFFCCTNSRHNSGFCTRICYFFSQSIVVFLPVRHNWTWVEEMQRWSIGSDAVSCKDLLASSSLNWVYFLLYCSCYNLFRNLLRDSACRSFGWWHSKEKLLLPMRIVLLSFFLWSFTLFCSQRFCQISSRIMHFALHNRKSKIFDSLLMHSSSFSSWTLSFSSNMVSRIIFLSSTINFLRLLNLGFDCNEF